MADQPGFFRDESFGHDEIGVTSWAALTLAPTFSPPDLALSGDDLAKFYAAAYRDGLMAAEYWSPETFRVAATFQVAAARVRREYPDADVTDVEIRLADGPRRMTWDEFEEWLRS